MAFGSCVYSKLSSGGNGCLMEEEIYCKQLKTIYVEERTVTDWIQRKLGLKVNMTKTHITRPQKLKYLGFGFYKDGKANEWKCRPHQDSVAKLKRKLKELTCRKIPGTVTGKIAKINQVTRGWINYYALGSMKTAMTEIDAHLRTRLRVILKMFLERLGLLAA